MELMKLRDQFNLEKTIGKDLFMDVSYVWEVPSKIKEYILKLGCSLDPQHYREIKKNVWIGKNVRIDSLSTIVGPCIIDDDTEIRPGAYLRENVIVGKNCVIGNSVEVKNSIIFDGCRIAHYNHVGDSILGYGVLLGAGVHISNLKMDRSHIQVKDKDTVIGTGLEKMGAVVGDSVNIGCNSVLFPGTVVGSNTDIYPLVCVRGVIASNSIMKSDHEVVKKEEK